MIVDDTNFTMAKTLAKQPTRLNHTQALPRFYLMSDPARLPDPEPYLKNLPKGGAVILRHKDPDTLKRLAQRIIPRAHALGLRVLLSGNVRLALQTGADGVHFSERQARRNKRRITIKKPGFFITAAAHNPAALQAAHRAGAQMVLLSPVFTSKSHPDAKPLGALGFVTLSQNSSLPTIALGGITQSNFRRLKLTNTYGFAAIELWTHTPT